MGSFGADGHLLLVVLFPFNFDCFYISFSSAALPSDAFSPVVLPCISHPNPQIGFDLAIKKARKEVV